MNRLITTSLVLALMILAGCGESDTQKKVGSAAPTSASTAVDSKSEVAAAPSKKDAPLQVRFDLLMRGQLPSVAVEIVPTPDGKSFFVLGRNGQIYHFAQGVESLTVGDGKEPKPVMKMTFDNVYAKGDLGSIGMVLDPHYRENHFFYVWCADAKDESVYLDRFSLAASSQATLDSRTRIIGFSRSQPDGPYHMGGILQFLADDSLVIMTGDAEHPHISQDPKNLNGKILRIMPGRGAEGGYTVPADNPHVGDEAWAPEIVATGLRAPFRGHLSAGKDFFIADVGAVHEEINYWKLDPTKAVDFGWGLGALKKVPQELSDGPLGVAGSIDPIVSWTREVDFSGDDADYAGETRMSAGIGPRYGAAGQDRYAGRLNDRLIFFDIMRGWVRSAALDQDMKITHHEHIGHMGFLAHVFEGKDGYVYALTWGPVPALYRMSAADDQAAAR